MRNHLLRSLVVTASFLVTAEVRGQAGVPAKPTPAQAQALLQSRPDLVLQLRQRIVTAGMTKEQVHTRLRTEGYPEDLLDPYLPGYTGEATTPSEDVFRAVSALGVVSEEELATLRGADVKRVAPRTPVDTIERAKGDTGGFAIFGLDLFRGSTSQFDPSLSGAVDATYTLNAGDRLVVILTGDVEASYSLDVTREGFVVLPQVGQVFAANLTLGQFESVLRSRLARVYSGIQQGTTHFAVSVARLHTNQIYVIGEAERPSSYQVSSIGTALTALYAAGGPNTNGSLRNIQIRRNGRIVDTLDVYDYLLRGDASHDVRLQNGDIVFIPVHGVRARVVGEVVRAATYELKGPETLADLIRFAGGFPVTAERRHVLIERILPPGERSDPGRSRVTIDIATAALTAGDGAAVPIRDGDVVHIFPIFNRMRDRIAVAGNVYEPGIQAFVPGMRVADVLRKAGGVRPGTYLGEVLIARHREDGSSAQLRVMLADTTGRVLNDIALQEDDSVTVWSVQTFKPPRYVAIGGEVNAGGSFPYREGMTLRDLILTANGLRESAWLREAEIARLPDSREGGVTATTLRVPLDSTYLFERKANGEYHGPPGVPAPASGSPDVLLMPYDNVLIMRQPSWELQRTVVVGGEVRYPGTYALTRKSERLSDVIKRAGGLTDEAYPEAMIFSRAQYNIGPVGIDLPTALRDYEATDNLILRDGDTIMVRQYVSLVTIRGAVNQPATVAYLPGKGIDYYINAAGGPARNADEDRAYVQQPNGKYEAVKTHLLRPASMPKPRAGSVVVVPERDPADKKDLTALVAQVGQIIAGLFTLIYLAKK